MKTQAPANIVNLPGVEHSKKRQRPPGNGDEPPMDTDDDLKDVQKRVTHIEAVLPTLATKADLQEVRVEMHSMKAELVKWIVGTAIGLGVAGITVMTFVLNNAVPKAPSAAPAPIVITLPATPPPGK